ncbi:hypothetical protein ACFE04_014959 [Oxalis oulophora]
MPPVPSSPALLLSSLYCWRSLFLATLISSLPPYFGVSHISDVAMMFVYGSLLLEGFDDSDISFGHVEGLLTIFLSQHFTYMLIHHTNKITSINALPDQTIFKSQPDVRQQCFSEAATRRPADLLSAFSTIKNVMNNLYDGLGESSTRTHQGHTHSGFTALHASSEEFSEWLNKDDPGKSNGSRQHTDVENCLLQSKEASSSGTKPENAKYSFICECFFMTARVLNLGLLKAFSDFKYIV